MAEKSAPNENYDIVEAGEEVKEASPPDINDLCRDTFDKTGKYLQGELAGTGEDYRLLEDMNKAVSGRVVEMKEVSANIERAMTDLNAKYNSLAPFLEQIDQIEKSVSTLEQSTYQLDAYSKRLEAKFKQLEKR